MQLSEWLSLYMVRQFRQHHCNAGHMLLYAYIFCRQYIYATLRLCLQIDIGWEHMNAGDAYIMDVGVILFVWLGKHCSLTEKRQVA